MIEKSICAPVLATEAPSELTTNNTFSLLIPSLQRAIASAGYTIPTPIQIKAIPELLDGRDLLGCAQTGTGKTAAFTLPILQHLSQNRRPPKPGYPRVLILAPTRELAAQIDESIRIYGRFSSIRHTVIFGGVRQFNQVRDLYQGVDIIVATPGRLLDLMEQKHIYLDAIETFVLDEADRMLDMGFIPDIRRIVAKLPAKRQTLFFSATLPPAIVHLSRSMVVNPVHITIDAENPTVDKINQKVIFADKNEKISLLISLLKNKNMDKVLVFTRTKHGANRVAKRLYEENITCEPIHGNKSQTARVRALDGFKSGRIRVLVATDIAARGLDVEGISHVINFDIPEEPETYIHRIGRTARAGASGTAIAFCSPEERKDLRDIDQLIHKTFTQGF